MKAAIYCRLSEEDRNKQTGTEDSNSIQNQKSMLLQYVEEHGWELYQIYSDDDYTGADRKRPAFNRLLEDAQAHRFDVILCKTQSRFTRELELVEKYINGLFPLWGIRFISVVDSGDTANKGNKKARQINGLVNEWYLEDMSENIRSVLDSRRKQGLHIGAFALYGYKKDPAQKGHLLIDEEAAAVVRIIFRLYSQGYGKTAIARFLNDRGIPNPTEYKHRQGLSYRPAQTKTGTLWKYSTISQMLSNEIYRGNMVQGRYGSVSYKTKQNKPRPQSQWYRVEGTHEAIIPAPLWEKVQALASQRSRPFGIGRRGLFAGKVVCAGCGAGMRSTKSRGRQYLQCANRYISKGACEGAFISVEQLEERVLGELKRLSEQYVDVERIRKEAVFRKDGGEERARLLLEVQACENKEEEYRRGLQALYLDRGKGVISEGDFGEIVNNFTQERRRLQEALTEKREQLFRLSQSHGEHALDQRLQEYLPPQRLTRPMVEAFVHHICIGKRIPGTRMVPIEIHWNF